MNITREDADNFSEKIEKPTGGWLTKNQSEHLEYNMPIEIIGVDTFGMFYCEGVFKPHHNKKGKKTGKRRFYKITKKGGLLVQDHELWLDAVFWRVKKNSAETCLECNSDGVNDITWRENWC